MDRDWLRTESVKPPIEPGSLVEFSMSERKSESLVSGMVMRVYNANERMYADVRAAIGMKGDIPLVPLEKLKLCSQKTKPFVLALLKGELAKNINNRSPFSVEKRLLKKAEDELTHG